MQIDQAHRARELKAGQLWKLEEGYVRVVELGPRHVHYRMLRRPEQTAALTRMIGLEAFLRYLHQSEAELENQRTAEPASGEGQRAAPDLALGILGNADGQGNRGFWPGHFLKTLGPQPTISLRAAC